MIYNDFLLNIDVLLIGGFIYSQFYDADQPINFWAMRQYNLIEDRHRCCLTPISRLKFEIEL